MTEQELAMLYSNIHSTLEKKYGKPIYGRNRAVYISVNFVIKVPTCVNGMFDNTVEASKRRKKDWEEYAQSKIITINDMPVLLMERLDIQPIDHKKLPDWAWYIDCFQVGFDKKGVLKAYDYGVYYIHLK